MLNSIAKIVVGASLFHIGKSVAKRETVIRINGKDVSNDKKEIAGVVLSIGGVVLICNAVNRLIK